MTTFADTGPPAPAGFEALFAEWYWSADPAEDDLLMYDPAPVQR